MRKVAIYARVSTEHEAQLSALDNQIQYYDEILEKHPDWVLYDRYIDEGITGTSVKKRKNFMRMIKDAEDECFDLIITREVCRFARNTVDTLQETRKLKRIGVEVWFVEDNIWTFNDDDGELKLTIMATLAQNESKKTSQRVKAGQKISFQNGVFYGTGNILGYDKIGKEMVVNEEQAKIVKSIFSMFLDGLGSTKIKYELEKRGYKTSTGLSVWSASYITRLLQNPFYCGTIVYRKAFVPDYLEQKQKKNKGEVEQVIVEGRHTPLISKEDFAKVQKIISARSKEIDEKRKVGSGVPRSVWTEKLVCNCGATFNKNVYHKNKDGEKTYCYQCYKQKKEGSYNTRLKRGLDTDNACDTPFVPEWKLNVIADILFKHIIKDKERIINIAKELVDKNIKEEDYNTYTQDEIDIYENKIETLNKSKNRLLDAYLAGIIKMKEYELKKQDIDQNIDKYENKILSIKESDKSSKSSILNRIQSIKNTIDKVFDVKEGMPIEKLLSPLIDKIIVKNDRFEWILSCFRDTIKVNINGRQDNSESVLVCNDTSLTFKLDSRTGRN